MFQFDFIFREEAPENCLWDTLPFVAWVALSATVIVSFALYRSVFINLVGWQGAKWDYLETFNQSLATLALTAPIVAYGGQSEVIGVETLIVIIASTIAFGALGEVSFLHNSLADWRSWSWRAWLVYISGLIVGLAIAGYHIFEAVEAGIIAHYLLSLLFWFLIGGLAYLFIYLENRKEANKYRFHPHHWYIFWFLSFYTRFATVFSRIFAGVCIGIYVHGCASFGIGSPLN